MLALKTSAPATARPARPRHWRFAARGLVVGLCLTLPLLVANNAAADMVLIRPGEAALPPAPPAAEIKVKTRGIVRRPRVELVTPQRSVSSPFNLKFVFRPIGGSVIKTGSVKLLYLKKPVVDLTPRVAPFITSNGIDVIGAEAPPGNHPLRIVVVDSEGRKASAVFVLKVVK